MGYLEDETAAIVQPWIEAGVVAVRRDDSASLNALTRRFPTVFNRIDWDKCTLFGHWSLANSDQSERHVVLRERARDFATSEGIPLACKLNIILDYVAFGLKTSFETLTHFLPMLCDLPVHVYAFPDDASWCINYTFENDYYIGRAPEMLGRPRTRRDVHR